MKSNVLVVVVTILARRIDASQFSCQNMAQEMTNRCLGICQDAQNSLSTRICLRLMNLLVTFHLRAIY